MNQVMQDKSFNLSVRIVNLYKYLTKTHKEYILSKQLLRSGTSIGANITEAQGAISNADFSAKLSIAYKEALESKYWLNLLKETNYLSQKEFDSIYDDVDHISAMLFKALRKTRKF